MTEFICNHCGSWIDPYNAYIAEYYPFKQNGTFHLDMTVICPTCNGINDVEMVIDKMHVYGTKDGEY